MQTHISLHFAVPYYTDEFQSSFFNSWIKKRNQHVQSYTEFSSSTLLSHANTFCYSNLHFHCLCKLILREYKDTEVFLRSFPLKLDSVPTSSLPEGLLHAVPRTRTGTVVSTGAACRGRTPCPTCSLVKRAAQGSRWNLINAVLETAHLCRQRLANHRGALKQLELFTPLGCRTGRSCMNRTGKGYPSSHPPKTILSSCMGSISRNHINCPCNSSTFRLVG